MNPRLDLLQPYPFERLRALLAGAVPPAALRHIPLSIGEPRHTPPAFVGRGAGRALGESLGSYPVALGLPELREAIARWLERRFGLPAQRVRADDMVLPVNGTREALFAFVQAAVDAESAARGSRPLVLMPNPFYQIYEGAALLAGAEPRFLNCTDGNGYLPDLDAVDAATWNRCQVLFLCTPGNPTGAVMPDAYLQRALELSARHDFVIASDECYSELYLDEASPPTGLLQAAFRAGNTRVRALRRVPQPVEALERAGPALGVRRRRRGDPRTLPALSHLPRLRRAGAHAARQHPGLERRSARRGEPSPVPREVRARHARDRGSPAAGHRHPGGRLLPLAARR